MAQEPDVIDSLLPPDERQQGAVGLKVLKYLGLGLRQNGKLVKIDDPRFDPMWEAAGALELPVLIHTGDPGAFFVTTDRFNERYEELQNHPEWSFYDRDFPKRAELHEARLRVIARHPKTRFIALHVGNDAEDLGQVGEWLDRHKNLNVEIGARLGELGRQPRTARKFFESCQSARKQPAATCTKRRWCHATTASSRGTPTALTSIFCSYWTVARSISAIWPMRSSMPLSTGNALVREFGVR